MHVYGGIIHSPVGALLLLFSSALHRLIEPSLFRFVRLSSHAIDCRPLWPTPSPYDLSHGPISLFRHRRHPPFHRYAIRGLRGDCHGLHIPNLPWHRLPAYRKYIYYYYTQLRSKGVCAHLILCAMYRSCGTSFSLGCIPRR